MQTVLTSFVNAYFLITSVLFVAVVSPTVLTLFLLWGHTCLLFLLWSHKWPDSYCCGASLSRLAVVPHLASRLVDIVTPAHSLCFLLWCNRTPMYMDIFLCSGDTFLTMFIAVEPHFFLMMFIDVWHFCPPVLPNPTTCPPVLPSPITCPPVLPNLTTCPTNYILLSLIIHIPHFFIYK